LPIEGLDYPNNKYIPDYALGYYPFVQHNLDIIKIGSSKTNTKIIKLDKIYPEDTDINFVYNYKDTFNYEFNKNELIITRVDEKKGWGQDLIGYVFIN
jgi:hypothetical protein